MRIGQSRMIVARLDGFGGGLFARVMLPPFQRRGWRIILVDGSGKHIEPDEQQAEFVKRFYSDPGQALSALKKYEDEKAEEVEED